MGLVRACENIRPLVYLKVARLRRIQQISFGLFLCFIMAFAIIHYKSYNREYSGKHDRAAK